MLRRVPLLLILLAIGLLLPTIASVADDELTKTFQKHNCKLTLPSTDWEWQEMSMDALGAGYIAQVQRQEGQAFARATIRVAPRGEAGQEPLPLESLVEEVKTSLGQTMGKVERSGTRKCKLSGLDGIEVVIQGEHQNGAPGMVRCLNIAQGNHFHQIIFLLANGASTKLATEVDAVRRGYRLLKGAGPMEEAPAEGLAPTEDFEDLEDLAAEGSWPENGPTREGRSVGFPHHNVKWTLPEGSPFKWSSPVADESKESGLMIVAGAETEREAAEDDDPTANLAAVLFVTGPAPPGFDPVAVVESEQVQGKFRQDLFDEVQFTRTKTWDDIPVGNVRGSALRLVGRKDNLVRYFFLYVVSLKGQAYEWRVVLSGGREVNDVYKVALKALVDGIEFPDTVEPISGPVGIPGIGTHCLPRGFGLGEERLVKKAPFNAKKPPQMAGLNYDQAALPQQRLAWEMRSEDLQSYLYFDVQTFAALGDRGRPLDLEDMVKDRAGVWSDRAEAPETVTKGREPYFKDKFGRGKGVGYEFEGFLNGVPFIERGYIVTYKKYAYWFRFQYGGENAEKTFSKVLRAIKKGIKFNT